MFVLGFISAQSVAGHCRETPGLSPFPSAKPYTTELFAYSNCCCFMLLIFPAKILLVQSLVSHELDLNEVFLLKLGFLPCTVMFFWVTLTISVGAQFLPTVWQ